MSQYDDDALRLSDICDGCGLMFCECDCGPDDMPEPGMEEPPDDLEAVPDESEMFPMEHGGEG